MSKKLTTEEFIQKSKIIHGNKYNYSLSEYINAKTKVIIICHVHGIFEQIPDTHINKKYGCPKCGGSYKKTTDCFISDAKIIHGDKYSYSLVEYKNNKTKIKIICPIHGIFEQTPHLHLTKKCGCPNCNKISLSDFINNANIVHNNKFDYSLVDISKRKIKIICPEHGIFIQDRHNHLKGNGCSKCSNLYNCDTTEFIEKAKRYHGDKYDYSLVEYKNATIKIKIICLEHGIFKQTPNNHLNGQGCQKCANNFKLTTEEFIIEAKNTHGDKYDYSLVKYINSFTPVIIICPIHGKFKQKPKLHKNGGKCPYCNASKGEEEISEYLDLFKIKYKRQYKFNDCKYKRQLPFDFYLPKQNLCIEFDGRQHFEPVKDFGGDEEFKKIKIRDKIKNEYCEKNKINILRIKYDQNINNELKIITKYD